MPQRLIGWITARSRLVRAAIAYIAAALVLTGIIGALRGTLGPRTGLVRTVYAEQDFKGPPLAQERTGRLDLAFLDSDARVPQRGFSVHWAGFWFVPTARTVRLSARGDGRVDVFVDRALALRQDAGIESTRHQLKLPAGPHELVVRYEQHEGRVAFELVQDAGGDAPVGIPPDELFPSKPSRRDFRRAAVMRGLERLLVFVWVIVPAIALLGLGVQSEWREWALPPWRDYCRRVSRLALPALLAPTLLFLVGPHVVFAANRVEFSVAFADIVWPWLVAAVGAGWLVLSAIGCLTALLSDRVRRGYLALLLAFSMLLWIQSTLLVGDYGLLQGERLQFAPFAWRAPYEAALWIAGAVLALVFARRLSHIPQWVSGVFIAAQLAGLAVSSPEAAAQNRADAVWSEPPDQIYRLSRSQNVIHITLDGFLSEIFTEQIERDRAAFDRKYAGFIFFADHLGAFPTTRASMPAMLTGATYRNQLPFAEFFRNTVPLRSISTVLGEHGFATHSITFHPSDHPPSPADDIRTIVRYRIPTPYSSRADYVWFAALQLVDLSLFRHVPQGMKPSVYNDDVWLAQDWYSRGNVKAENARKVRPSNHVAFLEAFTRQLSVTQSEPVYTFIHVAVPHPPIVVDSKCSFVGLLSLNRGSYTGQARCSLLVVQHLLDRLRSLDVYDRSVILLTSDHGWSVGRRDHPLRGVPTPAGPLDRIALGAMPLLVVKPVAASGPLRVSYAPTAITDVPATILDLVQLPNVFPGTPALRIDPTVPRARTYTYHSWVNADWARPYFDALYVFSINGRVTDRRSWRLQERIPQPADATAARR